MRLFCLAPRLLSGRRMKTTTTCFALFGLVILFGPSCQREGLRSEEELDLAAPDLGSAPVPDLGPAPAPDLAPPPGALCTAPKPSCGGSLVGLWRVAEWCFEPTAMCPRFTKIAPGMEMLFVAEGPRPFATQEGTVAFRYPAAATTVYSSVNCYVEGWGPKSCFDLDVAGGDCVLDAEKCACDFATPAVSEVVQSGWILFDGLMQTLMPTLEFAYDVTYCVTGDEAVMAWTNEDGQSQRFALVRQDLPAPAAPSGDPNQLVIAKPGDPPVSTMDPGLETPADCPDGVIESNDTLATAVSITSSIGFGAPGTPIAMMAICPAGSDDIDFFSIDLSSTSSEWRFVRVDLEYDVAYGDLDVALLDAAGNIVARDGTQTSNGCVAAQIQNGRYYIGVRGAGGDVNRYQLQVRVDNTPPNCVSN